MKPRLSPDFDRPPLAETALGLQFDPLPGLRLSHLSAFLHSHDLEPGSVLEKHALGQTIEPIGKEELWIGRPLRLEMSDQPPLRLLALIKRSDGERLVQVENGWLVFNWRAGEDSLPYPRYTEVRREFDSWVERLVAFLGDQGLESPRPNLWEVSYVNVIPQDKLWTTVQDWNNVLPGLFSRPSGVTCGQLQTAGGRWVFQLGSRGRLQIVVEHGRRESPRVEELLLLKLIARGKVDDGAMDSFQHGLALGHESIVNTFVELASERALKHWGYRG